MKKKVDFLIVGQGIAGTMLGWFLQKQGKSFIIIDQYNTSSASQVAAGIIHPITGRRIVKTWLADTLVPFSKDTYKEIENFFTAPFFHNVPVVELLDSPKEYNDWLARSSSSEMRNYINTEAEINYEEFLHSSFKTILINYSGWVDVKQLLQAFRNYFLKENLLIEEVFDGKLLKLQNESILYNNIEASKIIFCEGVAAMKNPFWKTLPFIPAKGEILTIRCEATFKHIITKKIFILPIGQNLFKVGSTYNWEDLTDIPTENAKQQLIGQLQKIIKIPFEVINHETAIRPSVKNRRPFIGMHPQYPEVGIFNGLGTKGCLLAPFFANHFVEFLTDEANLMREIDVRNLMI